MPEGQQPRICPFCEATCGLLVETRGTKVERVRGDPQDVFSGGFMCPKGTALADLHEDPDRLRAPLLRRDGRHQEVSWDEAFEAVERGLSPILEADGPDALGIYLGNPNVHNASLGLYGPALLRGFRSRNRFSASTLDQFPKQVAAGLMFGTSLSVAVPDIDRCQFLLVLGANPVVSNGSLFTVPDFRGRLRALQGRGGKLVVVDPRRSETAALADRHLSIRPGTDGLLLAALAHHLLAEDLAKPGRLRDLGSGEGALEAALEGFSPDAVATVCGIPANRIRELAGELAHSESAAVYGRIGTTTTEFGTTTSWLVDVLNYLTGNLDRPGGAMFPRAAAFSPNTRGPEGRGAGIRLHRRRSRVRAAPEVFGEFPAACLAEEIETPGTGRIRALLTLAGNPALSAPNGARLSRAMASLDFMVSVDIYLNETTRHADVILPGGSPLEQCHFDSAFPNFAIRNQVRYSPPVFPAPEGSLPEWKILLRLLGVLQGQGPHADVGAMDDAVIGIQVQASIDGAGSPLQGRSAQEILAALAPRVGPERLIDFALRSGPYGDHFGGRPDGLSLDELVAHPHGIDLGALEPRLPELLRTPSGKIELAPPLLLEDLERMRALLSGPAEEGLLLVGRRHLRSNNSWMHNLPRLASGRSRCTLQVNPQDAKPLGLGDGEAAKLRSRVGEVRVEVEITTDIRPGVVCLPHGWGHDAAGSRLAVAQARPGVNSNRLSDDDSIEAISGTAILNGIPVELEPLTLDEA